MRYYADLGVSFKVCGQAAEDFGYAVKDFQDFIEVVPNAITELAHWQQQGYALITPQILEKTIDRVDPLMPGQSASRNHPMQHSPCGADGKGCAVFAGGAYSGQCLM